MSHKLVFIPSPHEFPFFPFLVVWIRHNLGRRTTSDVDRHWGVNFFYGFGKNKTSDGYNARTTILNAFFFQQSRLGTALCGPLHFCTLFVQAQIVCLSRYSFKMSKEVPCLCCVCYTLFYDCTKIRGK